MIAIDTNILVRYVTAGNDPAQEAAAVELIDGACTPADPALVVSIVLAELVWVLQSSFSFPKSDIVKALAAIGENPNLAFEDPHEFSAALDAFRERRIDFADCLIAARALRTGASKVRTFDRSAARQKPFELLPTGT